MGEAIRIEDLGSKNGTFVDGSPVDRAPLVGGSIVRIGDTIGCLVATAEGCEPAVAEGRSSEGLSLAPAPGAEQEAGEPARPRRLRPGRTVAEELD